MPRAWLLCCAVGLAPAASADPITYSTAIARAGADSPNVTAGRAAVDAAQSSIRPAGQLPDPQLALGFDNVPVTGADRLRLNRDEMTMLSVGVMQDVPNKATRQARTAVAEAGAGAARANLDVARLKARMAAAEAWIEGYYTLARIAVLERLGREIGTLSEATDAGVAAASTKPDAALSARLDVARLADRLATEKAGVAKAEAELERWVGPLNGDTPGPLAPVLPINPSDLRAHLEHHVELATSQAEIARTKAELDLARSRSKSDWSWELAYQKRDDSFGDMVSLGLKFSLPLFQSSRQSPTVDARRSDVVRASSDREAMLREHRAILEAGLAEYSSLSEQQARSRSVILPLARQRESVVAAAHGAGTATLADLIAARRDLIEVELTGLDVDRRLTLLSAILTLEYGEAGHDQ